MGERRREGESNEDGREGGREGERERKKERERGKEVKEEECFMAEINDERCYFNRQDRGPCLGIMVVIYTLF